jgi:murein DD-endopeptidase MepM/ murein hydrolase activator NlpD
MQVLGNAAVTAAPVAAPLSRATAPVRAPSRFPAWFHNYSWTPDLAQDIGSARWFRELAAMLALVATALLLWSSFEPVQAAPVMRLDDTAAAEFRTNTLRPTPTGGEMGRRMDMTSAVVPLEAAPERPTIELAATLGQGDSFGRMLQRAGVGAFDAARVSDMVAAAVPLQKIQPGTRFAIVLGHRVSPTQPRPLDALAFRARFDLAIQIRRQGDGLVMARNAIAVDSTPLRIKGIVGSSLYRSARAAGAPPAAIQAYLRTLDQYISIEQDIAPSDEFDFVVSYKRSAAGESEAGDLLYASVIRGGKPTTQLVRWGPEGQFYEAGGSARTAQTSGSLIAPVAGRITSGFGMRRHPILGFSRMHAGIDFGAPWGAPIYAVTDGTVVFAGHHGGHGNYVKLDHGGGIGTGYAHMSRIAVSPGERMRKGQVIGYVGSTGLSTGPHLHYELYRGGVPVNPASVGFVVRAEVDVSQMAAFKARLAQMQAVRPGAALGPLGHR